MNDDLRINAVEEILKCVRKILVIQQEVINDRKLSGNKTYTIDEYNKEISKFGNNFNTVYIEKNMYISKIINYLTNNVLLSDEEIDELINFIREGLLKYKIENDKLTNGDVFHLIEMMLIKNKNFDEKFCLYSKFLFNSINDIELKYGFNMNLTNFYIFFDNKYICYLDEFGKDAMSELDNRIKGEFNIYLEKDLAFGTYSLGLYDEDAFFYKKDNKYFSFSENDKGYKKCIKVLSSYNNILSKFGLETKEFYTKKEILHTIYLLKNFNYLSIIKECVDVSVNWWDEVIFNKNDDEYNDYNKLLPSYTMEQREVFKNRLGQIILKKLIHNQKVEINVIPCFGNKLIDLMNELFIIPSCSSFNKTMKLDLWAEEVIIVDNVSGKEDVLYSKNQMKKTK